MSALNWYKTAGPAVNEERRRPLPVVPLFRAVLHKDHEITTRITPGMQNNVLISRS
jgi:hypothetical protein